MFLDVSLSTLTSFKGQKVEFNEVVITRRDIINMPQLMQYFTFNKIHVKDSARLDSYPIGMQNDIGLIFFEYYGYIIYHEGIRYLNELKFKQLFAESETIMEYFRRALLLKESPPNTINIEIIPTKQLNDLVLNFLYRHQRNFRNHEKNIKQTENLFDVDINNNKFTKITNLSEFLTITFNRYIRTQKGSIPFSGDFGGSIKQSLQMKAADTAVESIRDELFYFLRDLSELYNADFRLLNIDHKLLHTIGMKLIVYITIQANNEEPVTFTLESQGD